MFVGVTVRKRSVRSVVGCIYNFFILYVGQSNGYVFLTMLLFLYHSLLIANFYIINRDINRHTNIDRQTDKNTHRSTDKQRQKYRQTNGQTEIQSDRQTDKRTDRNTDRSTDRLKYTQIDRQQKYRQTEQLTCHCFKSGDIPKTVDGQVRLSFVTVL